jgi:hypothetical protein
MILFFAFHVKNDFQVIFEALLPTCSFSGTFSHETLGAGVDFGVPKGSFNAARTAF